MPPIIEPNPAHFTINQGLTESKVKSFAQSYPQPTNPYSKPEFTKNIKGLAFTIPRENDFISAKVLILCTPSYCPRAGPFGPY